MILCLSKVSFKQWKQNTEKQKQNMEIFQMSHISCIPGRHYHFESASYNSAKLNTKQRNRGSGPQHLTFKISNLLPNPELTVC